ncbi:isoprenoid synthase domain-containing protein [Suillus discolor]|uniref:Terpene synthase n=1 Tax=Suillus discolor TaxID=1912936 RepID=A0A9P7FFA8_9AGAM|nr:isoprenoid synthase domain-containing protein [Suillus discolor]KAG2114146.1 isoprenoid synthase domain-containing protein [Suillus discolor]
MLATVANTTTPDTESSQFILPDLINDCHYPVRQNPHYDAAYHASVQWLMDVAQLVEPEIRGYIDMDANGLGVVCYPDADAFHLQVCSDFLNWIFVIDDWMESGVVDARKVHETCISVFRDPINFDTERVDGKMCKSFFSRFKETAGPGCTQRFIDASELYFAAVAKQVDDCAKGHVYDIGSYIALRRHMGAMRLFFNLIEFAARIDLPDEVVSHPVVKALEDATNDHVCWHNDILSYNKEQSRGHAPWENIVPVIMYERGLDLQGAMDYAGQMCKDAIQRFDSNRAMLPSWGEEVDRQVAIYIEGLQHWIAGSLRWHFDCARYAVSPDRIIKLLPKRPYKCGA